MAAEGIGQALSIEEDVITQYKGNTQTAALIIRGYRELMARGASFIIPVRGDNYCGLRSVLYVLMCHWPRHTATVGSSVRAKFERLKLRCANLLPSWSFAGRLEPSPRSTFDVLAALDKCVAVLESVLNTAASLKTPSEREEFAAAVFNGKNDIFVLEAVKVLMLGLFV